MKFLRAFARKRALQRYAHELAARLHRDYGASEFYTPPQIRAAVARLRLSPDLIMHGYAMFLPAETFDALDPEVRGAVSYQEARAEVARYRRSTPSDSGGFHESGIGFVALVQGGGGHQGDAG